MYKKLDARVHAKEDTLRCKFLSEETLT